MPLDELPLSESDHNLLQRITDFLYQKGYSPHRDLEIRVEQGVVLMRGRMATFYLRQVAIECVRHVAGVTHVIDLIEVDYDRSEELPADTRVEDPDQGKKPSESPFKSA